MTDTTKEFAKELRADINKLQRYSTEGRSTTHFSTITCNHQKFDGKWYFRLDPSYAADTLNKLFCIAKLYDEKTSLKLLQSIFTYSENDTDRLIIKFNSEISDQVREELLENELMVLVIKDRIADHHDALESKNRLTRLRKEAMERQGLEKI